MTDQYDDQAHYGHTNDPIDKLRKGGQFKEIDAQLVSFQKGMEELALAESGSFGSEPKLDQLARATSYLTQSASIVHGVLRKLKWELHKKERTLYLETRNRYVTKPTEKVIEGEMLKDKSFVTLTEKVNELEEIADLFDSQAKQIQSKQWLRHQYKKEDNNLYQSRRYE